MNTGDTVLHMDSNGIGTITGYSDPSGYPMVDFGRGESVPLPPYELARVFDFSPGIHFRDVLVGAGAAKNVKDAEKIIAEKRFNFSFLAQQPEDISSMSTGLYLITMLKGHKVTYYFAARIKEKTA